jgi:ABC-type oligopeptide transport system ATPase subunit
MANAIVVYRGKPKVNSWARWMVGRTLRQNKNNLISVIGQTGSGKTYTAISICEIMSKMDGVPFGIDYVVFSLRELMDLINSGKLKRGSKIIFDEPQVSISAREFQSEANKVFNYLLSTFRHRNLTLFFCTPFETLLDKNSRRLFHARFETMSINRNNNTCRIKPRFIEYSDFKTDAYRKQLIVMFKDENGRGKSQKLFYWDVPKPSDKLIELYEQKKLEFTNNLNKNISERLKRFDESGKSLTAEQKDEVVKRKPLTPTQERVMNVLASVKESNKFERASEILKISMSAIHKNKTLAEKKGYVVEEFKENDD